MEINKPKVVLINWTRKPIETMCWARRVMHSAVPDTLEELEQNPEKWLDGETVDGYTKNILLNDGMPGFLEYINLTFKLENVSRALQQQLTRHRIGFSYCIQSMRCVNVPKFAEEGAYTPCEIGNKEEFHKSMVKIQDSYNVLLGAGMPTQDARGILPMNIHSTVTFSCSLRAFIGMISKRLCTKTQGEFRDVAQLMVREIKEKMDTRLMHWIKRPCEKGYCIMKAENEMQYNKNKLAGKDNTDHVCPLYIKIFKEKKK